MVGNEEFLTNVTGTSDFAVQDSFALNPGLASSFPWLSSQAQGWERYKFRKLNFRYTTSTGSTTPGTAILAPDYDAADAAPATEQVALTYKDRQYCPPWELDKLCKLSPASMNAAYKEHFIRTGALAANQDIKTYDVGNLHLCTSGGTAVQWGKVFVEYIVDFFGPQMTPSGLVSNDAEKGTAVSGMTAAKPFGTVQPTRVDSLDTPLTVWTDVGAGTLTFSRPFSGIIYIHNVGTVMTAVAAPGGTATIVELGESNDGDGFSCDQACSVVADEGETFIFSAITATTVTASIYRLVSCPATVFA